MLWLTLACTAEAVDDCHVADVRPLEPSVEAAADHKLVTFVPTTDAAAVLAAMHGAGAGVIGECDCCAFQQAGTGSFRAGTDPTIGTLGAPAVLLRRSTRLVNIWHRHIPSV